MWRKGYMKSEVPPYHYETKGSSMSIALQSEVARVSNEAMRRLRFVTVTQTEKPRRCNDGAIRIETSTS